MVIFANKYVFDIDVAQDIVQEVFMKLYEKKDELIIHTSLKAFLFSAVRNKCIDYIRSSKVRQRHKDTILKESSIFTEDTNAEIIHAELQERIYKAIETLPDQNEKKFKLSRFEGKQIKKSLINVT